MPLPVSRPVFFARRACEAKSIRLYTRPRQGVIAGSRSLPQKAEHRTSVQSGAIAQLGERFNGIEEVVGSIPSGSTKLPDRECIVGLKAGRR